MRRIELNMNENEDYEVIKKLVETNGNKNTAVVKLGVCLKTINRMIKGYQNLGKKYFVHGNKGRQPIHTISEETKQLILDLYKNKYYDANFLHFIDLLAEHENIVISETAVRTILNKDHIISPKATRKTKRKHIKELQEKQEKPGLTQNEKIQIAQSIIDIEDAHPRRPRCAYFGEMIQMDASIHLWFGDSKTQFHIAVDDSTGAIVGAYFDKEETLNGYYNITNQILIQYGIPSKFLTDRRTVFEYKKISAPADEEDTFTQFGYACKQLGIEIQTSSVPQAKGRVERMFQTLQSRLPLDMRLAGVTDIDRANEFLNSYIKKFNAKFSLPIDHSKSVFEKQPSLAQINLTLAVLTGRTVDNGHCIKFEKKYYKTVDAKNNYVYHHKGTKALVIKAFDKELYATIDDTVYALEEVPIRAAYSKNFDILTDNSPKEKTKYIPAMNHPWRNSSFEKFVNSQSHRKEKTA